MGKRNKKSAYVDDLHNRLKDPAYAAEYLNNVLSETGEGEDAAFLLALRDVAEGLQMSKVASSAGVNRENLYRMLSGRGNPRLSSLLAVMRALGLRLLVQHECAPIPKGPATKRSRSETTGRSARRLANDSRREVRVKRRRRSKRAGRPIRSKPRASLSHG
jgi:probable addiction module antidote protein